MNLVSFDNTSMASEKYIHPQKYRMKKLRIKKVDANLPIKDVAANSVKIIRKQLPDIFM